MIDSGDLENRNAHARDDAPRSRARRRPDDTPVPLAERLAAARALRPAAGAHCGCCFGQGRDAVLRVIEGGEGLPSATPEGAT